MKADSEEAHFSLCMCTKSTFAPTVDLKILHLAFMALIVEKLV